ncbi:MAG TPA: methionyl-tRNA formyltransferase [Polyangiaceae bacterium]|nr:methionyl-tRNA formyltransferase [Polyangiaceae bacterium]
MRALFFGTPEIAVPALEALCEVAEVVGVVSQPDRPAGRGLALRAPAVKERALQLGLAVVQPTKVRTDEFAAWVRSRDASVALVMAYGRILPPAVLDAPSRGCMNLHASLLPKYRGASPITWAVVHGERETGISLMQMDAGLDTGPVYAMRRITIDSNETSGELAVRLARLAADVVRDELVAAMDGRLCAEAQDAGRATLAPILTREHGRLDWGRSAHELHDHVRGMQPWPGAWTRLRGKLMKVLRTRERSEVGVDAAPGTVVLADGGGLVVACRQGSLELLQVQLEGRKAMAARDFVAGRAVQAGDRLDTASGE